MSRKPYRVIVVLDRAFGARLKSIPYGIPVWIIASPENRAATDKTWHEHPQPSHLIGITIFNSPDGISAERSLIGQLDTIDLHHGFYSADPPYEELEVLGASVTDAIRSELAALGFMDIRDTEAGFLAVRPTQIP